ncbi:hypothetical protein [Bailinhaonella thermotolerans]|uniref:Uncharacterized protein n=1 Tax=Bailinhaonella thermotolerans TaxID=1070861 RepID=A0A3A4A658_9ACTN|nr:hypothetical protein [Bailinhaonella thermotolerans]RJL21097.1 hypothetical protein D5H75_38450 [Bailinhaonella thermotolerans]
MPSLPDGYDLLDEATLARVHGALRRLPGTGLLAVVPFTAGPAQLSEHLRAHADWELVSLEDEPEAGQCDHDHWRHIHHPDDMDYVVLVPYTANTARNRRVCYEAACVVNAVALGLPPGTAPEAVERLIVIAALASLGESDEMDTLVDYALGRAPSPLLISPE